jgi:UDP-N-acetyl-2-amino-2-deoxyglucuronate dehydrogenase
MSATLRLAVVGCGDVAGYTAWFARLNPRIRLAACCDRDEVRAVTFARRHHVPAWYKEYADLLAAGGFEAVYLAVPHDLHLPLARQAIQAGLAVLLEKPLANGQLEGQTLAAEVAQYGARLAVNYQYRYDAACYALARVAQSGALGKIRYARCNVPWERQAAYFAGGASWHASRARSGGGTLLTQASHFLDVLLWACGSPALRAQGLTRNLAFGAQGVEVEDLAMGQVELQDGALIQLCSSMAVHPEQPATLELYGERGTLFYRAGWTPRLEARGLRVRLERPPAPGVHALARSLEAFRRYAQGGEPHLATADQALATLTVVDALYRAAQSGGWEPVRT